MRVNGISNQQNNKQNFGIRIVKNDAYKEVYKALNLDLKLEPEKINDLFKVIQGIHPLKTILKKLEFLPLERVQQVSHECCGGYRNGTHWDGVKTIITENVYLPFFVKGRSDKPIKQKMLLYATKKNPYSSAPPLTYLGSAESSEQSNTFLQNIINKLKENYKISGKMAGKRLSKSEIKRLDNILEIGREDIQESSQKAILSIINLPENQYQTALKLMPLKSTKITQVGLGLTNEQTANLFNFEQIIQLSKLDDARANLAIRLGSLKDKYFGTVYQGEDIVSLLTREDIQKQLSEICSSKINRKAIDDIHKLVQEHGGRVGCCYHRF